MKHLTTVPLNIQGIPCVPRSLTVPLNIQGIPCVPRSLTIPLNIQGIPCVPRSLTVPLNIQGIRCVPRSLTVPLNIQGIPCVPRSLTVWTDLRTGWVLSGRRELLQVNYKGRDRLENILYSILMEFIIFPVVGWLSDFIALQQGEKVSFSPCY